MSSGSSSQRPKKEKSAFDEVVDLGSVPPPPGVVGPDVHAARTAIAALPTTLLEELRRVKRAGSFTNEAPTKPGKDGMRLLRPLAPDVHDVAPTPAASDLESAMALAMAREAVTEAPPPPPAARISTPIATPIAAPIPTRAPTPVPTPVPSRALSPLPEIVRTPPMAVPAPPFVLPMAPPPPVEAPRPQIRIELLVVFTIVGGAALVFALLALANRFFVTHP